MAAKAMFSTLFSLLPLSIGISTLTSCGAEDSISRRFLCRFTFHTQNHPGNTLEIALNGFGTYTFVSASYKNNIWHIYSTPNDGRNKPEDIRITASTELQYAKVYNLGANNGIIIGNSNFNKYRAYDRQCPNCIDQYGGYQLSSKLEFFQPPTGNLRQVPPHLRPGVWQHYRRSRW